MSTISLENAIAVFKKHKELDAKEIFTNEYTPSQSCAALIVEYAQGLRQNGIFLNQAHGAKLSSITLYGKPLYQVRKEDSIFIFEEIPKVVLAAFGAKFGDCYNNCINASSVGFWSDTLIHVSETGILPEEQTGVAGVLHSYLEHQGNIYDLSLGIVMSKSAYDKLFNVKEISTLSVGKVQSDLSDGTLEALSKKEISAEVYLMARDDCAKMVTKDK